MMSINLNEQNVREHDKTELIIPTDKFERPREWKANRIIVIQNTLRDIVHIVFENTNVYVARSAWFVLFIYAELLTCTWNLSKYIVLGAAI